MKYNASEQTLAWIKDRYLEGSLEIRPPYQRRPVWTVIQKSNLIESILLGLPVPEIYIHTVTSDIGKTTYAVVDGQQRVRAILQFLGIDKDESEVEENQFALSGLAGDSLWRNTTFAELNKEQKEQFFGHQLAVRFLSKATDEDVRDLFRRLNTYLTKLNDQELRNSTYSGPFVQLVNKLADDDYWAENGIVSAALIRRMKDMEFVSELLIGVMDGPQGSAGKIIDDYYYQLEQNADEFPDQKQVEKLYNRAFALIKDMFPDVRGTRWKNRTDFYTLFEAIAELLKDHTIPLAKYEFLKQALTKFGDEVDKRISDETAVVSTEAASYAPAAQRGSSDKSRRAVRHMALREVIKDCFTLKQSN
jgi:hypothetical protein